MARVLVIGGTLFIGRALVEMLLEHGDDVVIMHRGAGTPFGDRVDEIRCDRNDVTAVRGALEGSRFDVVYDNVYDFQRGTTGDQVRAAAIAASEGLERYVFMSSVAVYGAGEFDENGPLVPSDYANPYSAQKADSERALFDLHHRVGFPVVTLRPAFVYGPYNAIDREAWFWDRLLAGRPIILPDDGSRTMQWVHARDVARAATLAANDDVAIGKAYNLANHPPITQLEYVELLARAAGTPARLTRVPRETIQQAGGALFTPPFYFGVYLDLPPITVRPDRAESDLGLELTPMEDGLRETYRWYRKQQRPQPDYTWEDRLLASVR